MAAHAARERADHIIYDANSGTHFCHHCGASAAGQPADAPSASFTAGHAACRKPYLPPPWPRPDRTLPISSDALAEWPGLEGWLRRGRIGAPALTLAQAITGLPLTQTPAAPVEPVEFVLCLTLLRRVPSMREHLLLPATRARLGDAWAPVLDDWHDLEARVHDVDDLSVYERLRRWAGRAP